MAVYTIKELSRLFSLPASTLRYYEEEGLLPPVEHLPNGQRRYTDAHVIQLHTIACLKLAGMTIAQQKIFFALEENREEHLGEILAMLAEKKQQTAEKICQLRHVEQQLARKLHFYRDYEAYCRGEREMPRWELYEHADFGEETIS